MDPAVLFEGVSKTFSGFLGRNRVEAVRELSLEVPRGEIFGLLGPNGSGKTTSIFMMLGLLRPTSGRVSVFGLVPGTGLLGTTRRGGLDLKRRIGFLPEEFLPPDLLTGEEILRYYGGFHGIAPRELERRIDHYLDLLSMQAARARKFREYSKGMQRRIGLAQVLLHEPELLILDEPTNGLDPIGVQELKGLLLELKAAGRTIIICSHVLPEIETICDRIAILHQGACVCSGLTRELLGERDRYQLVLEAVDSEGAEKAARLLRDHDFNVSSVGRTQQTLERLFMDRVGRAKADPKTDR